MSTQRSSAIAASSFPVRRSITARLSLVLVALGAVGSVIACGDVPMDGTHDFVIDENGSVGEAEQALVTGNQSLRFGFGPGASKSYVGMGGGTTRDVEVTGNKFTVEAWVRPMAWPASGSYAMIVNNEGRYRIGINSSGNLVYNLNGPTSWATPVATSLNVPINSWSHVMLTYDGAAASNQIQAYVDTAVANGTGTANLSDANSLNVFRIGGGCDPANTTTCLPVHTFNGYIDEVRIWDKSFRTNRTANMFAKVENATNLAGVWHFDESSGDTAADSDTSDSTAYNGTLTNGVWHAAAGAPLTSRTISLVYGGRAYTKDTTLTGWTTAKSNCTAETGFDLVAITSQAEQDAFLASIATTAVWTGLNDRTTEGTFVWSNGSAFSYTNWNSGNPAVAPANAAEDCVVQWELASSGKWADRDCTETYGYACESKHAVWSPPIPETTGVTAGSWCGADDSNCASGTYCYDNGTPGTANNAQTDDYCMPRSCKELKDANSGLSSGTYKIDPDGTGSRASFDAYCDMTFDDDPNDGVAGGGWTLIFARNAVNDITHVATQSTSVAPGDSEYLPVANAKDLANLSEQVHIRTWNQADTASVTSYKHSSLSAGNQTYSPIKNLRNGLQLNSFTASVDYPYGTYWFGPNAIAARLWCTDIGTTNPYPAVWWGKSNSTGLHLFPEQSKWSCDWAGSACAGVDSRMEVYVR